jgi:hypothetical protein
MTSVKKIPILFNYKADHYMEVFEDFQRQQLKDEPSTYLLPTKVKLNQNIPSEREHP